MSYVSLQVMSYQPHLPIAMPNVDVAPADQWTFAHVEATNIFYVFPNTESSNFIHIGRGSFSIPEVWLNLLHSIDVPALVCEYGKRIQAAKAKQNTERQGKKK